MTPARLLRFQTDGEVSGKDWKLIFWVVFVFLLFSFNKSLIWTRYIKVWMDNCPASLTGRLLTLMACQNAFFPFIKKPFRLIQPSTVQRFFVFVSVYRLGHYISRNFPTWTHFVSGRTSFAETPFLFAQVWAGFDYLSDSDDILQLCKYEHMPRLS